MSALPKAMADKLEAARREEAEAEAAAKAAAASAQEGAETASESTTTASEGTTTVSEGSSNLDSGSVPTEIKQGSGTQTGVDNSASYAKLESQLERVLRALDRLEDENKELKAKLAENHKPVVSEEPVELTAEDLSDEEKAAFKQSLPVIEKLAKKIATEMTNPLRMRIKELEGEVKTTKTSYADMSEKVFSREIIKNVPDMQRKVTSPRWQTYLNSKIPRTNLLVKDALLSAHNSRDLDTIVEIFADFKLESSALTSQAMPGSVKASPQTKAQEKLKFSDRKQISEDFRKGRITKQRFDELVAAYDKAEQEGRVNFDT